MADTRGGYLLKEAEEALIKDLPISRPLVYRTFSEKDNAFWWEISFYVDGIAGRRSIKVMLGEKEFNHLMATSDNAEAELNELVRMQIRMELGLDG